MRRTATAAVLACAALLAVSIVSPAFGGPSISSVAKTAKKALKTGKAANRSAAAAKRSARTANTTANRALSSAGDGAGAVTVVDGPKVTDASSVAGAQASCPAGAQLISGGHNVGIRDIPSSAKMYGTSLYGVIAVNIQFETAEAQATATCSTAGASAATARSAAADRRALADFQADVRRVRAGLSPPN